MKKKHIGLPRPHIVEGQSSEGQKISIKFCNVLFDDQKTAMSQNRKEESSFKWAQTTFYHITFPLERSCVSLMFDILEGVTVADAAAQQEATHYTKLERSPPRRETSAWTEEKEGAQPKCWGI